MNMPTVPNVSIPNVNLPKVPFVGGSDKNQTSYAMDSSALHHSRTAASGDDEEAGDSNRKSNRGDGFVDEPARHSRTWEEKEKEESFTLEEDLYSLMYLCRPYSITMLVVMSVFLLQIFILALILADLTWDAPTYSEVVFFPLQVPIDIDTTVAVAQCVSLIVATIKEEDIFVSLKALIIVGHDERVSVRFPGATPFKWWLANTFRFITGLGNVVVSFYFIVGSDNVLDIFESFAALEFVSYIDNMVFKLARWGYTGKVLQRMTIKVESVQMENRREKGRWWAVLVVIFLSLTIIPLITLWSKVIIAQGNGFYLEKSISASVLVRFGDEDLALSKSTEFIFADTARDLTSFDQSNPPELKYAYFSGNYKISYEDNKLDRHNGRPVYFERNAALCKTDPACGMFYYCEEIGTWVYTIRSLGTARKELDKCKWGWLAQSQQTEVYSLEEVPDAGWKVFTGVMTETTVFITSDSCYLDSDCSLNGVCEEGTCNCFENWQGRRCDVPSPYCPAIAFVDYGKSSYDYTFVVSYELAKNDDDSPLEVYDRPVYYRTTQVAISTCPSGTNYEIYLYTGRRWFMSNWCEEDLKRYFNEDGEFRMEENLHAFWDNVLGLEIRWFSELTDSYAGTGLQMFEIRDSYSTGSGTGFGVFFESDGTFECLDVPCAGNSMVCGRKGACEKYIWESKVDSTNKTFHKCACTDYYGGIFCQFSPYGEYTRDHFEAFQSNATAALEPSPYEYQSRYWQPLLAAGVAPNASITTQQDLVNGDNTGGEVSTAPNSSGAGNIFSNRSSSATEEGEL